MKYEEIQALLERYWEGETSLEEERALKAYFNAGAIDDRLRAEAPLFQALKEEQLIELKTKARSVGLRPQIYQWAAAASVALLLAAGWWMLGKEKNSMPLANQPQPQIPSAMPDPETQHHEVAAVVEPQAPIINKKPAKRRVQPLLSSNQPKIDPETAIAMAEIKAALALVSAKLDKGKKQAVQKASYLDVVEKLPRKKEG
ncbi:MAG: hypothetical protein JNN28_07170 [Saprospiraceae bacterium]|nr:hypothetical protein [Saprospiraceae bacterium]